jgi:hypothetical protein
MKRATILVLTLAAIAFGTGALIHAATDRPPVPDAVAQGDGQQTMQIPPSIERDLDPVIVPGAYLPRLTGTPTDELLVYAYRDGGMDQIPFQVDEVDEGAYVGTTGNPLDGDDEIVFMASDLGGRLLDERITATMPISPTWYRIEVTDPLSPTMKGWAYVVRSSSLTRTFTQTYASFDPVTKWITSTRYTLGFLSSHPGFDYLALNQSGQDILDRTKVRIQFVTEDMLPAQPPVPTKDGPVRVIVPKRGMMGYRSLIYTWVGEDLMGATSARLSTDFNENAIGATFYNATTPLGVPIDGISDTVGAEPLSPWWQMTHDTGTVVQVADSSGVGGTQTNYYKDDGTIDPMDTGDKKSYGETGIQVQSPNPTIIYRTALYVLPPGLPNVGELYAAHAAYPLQVTATAPGRYRVYLPAALRHWPTNQETVVLHAIDNPDGDGAYTISWDPADAANAYALQEATHSDFSDAAEIYSGPATSCEVSGRGAARYRYRVQALNAAWSSDWSNVEWVDVLWEGEPNDDAPTEANGPIVSGLTYYGTFPSDADGKDYYTFELSTTHSVELWLTHIPAGQDYDLVLRDADMDPVEVSARVGSVFEHISTDPLSPGKYYIELVNVSGSGSVQPYHLGAVYADGS